MSATRKGDGTSRSASKTRRLSVHSSICRASSGEKPDDDGVLEPAVGVDGGDHGVAGAGQRAGGLGDLAQHGVDVEARADAQDGRRERGDPFAQRLDLPPRFAVPAQWVLLPDAVPNPRPARACRWPAQAYRRARLKGLYRPWSWTGTAG